MPNHYLFGIFDGHGGTSPPTQVPKSPSTSNATSPSNCTSTPNSKQKNIKKPSSKPSIKWIILCSPNPENGNSTVSFDITSPMIIGTISSPKNLRGVRLMCVLLPRGIYMWPMLVIPDAWRVRREELWRWAMTINLRTRQSWEESRKQAEMW